MILHEPHIDDDTPLHHHFTALISTSCKFPSQRKRNIHVTWFSYKRSRDVNKWHHALKVSHHTISPIIEVDRLLLPGFFIDIPVDFLFVVNTLENIQTVQSFSDERLQR